MDLCLVSDSFEEPAPTSWCALSTACFRTL